MPESRKEFEKDYYNKSSNSFFTENNPDKWNYGIGKDNQILSAPYRYINKKFLNDIAGKKILDYCCGKGEFSILPALRGARVEGIDISDKSIEIANARADYWKVSDRTNFQAMDAENLDFQDKSFDIILSYSSLSYLDLDRTYAELSRVLKNDGFIVIIDTLGHNPVLNMNRRKYIKAGKRQQFHYDHILKFKDIILARKYFKVTSVLYFDLLVLVSYPFRKLPGFKVLYWMLRTIDKMILKISPVNRLAFKVVFSLRQLG
ncbi:MAG: class I SAM-dependent methyltransferase [Candidatus Electryonea clarkiae]|nr:class I SAM-dependent methyltransferase [Candidatus Electryonea clarkiae]MDP8285848.1 class I SAM-dependent methyltransferase [Candidatus Electryonea clarkiae]